jgi:hypothetical protein
MQRLPVNSGTGFSQQPSLVAPFIITTDLAAQQVRFRHCWWDNWRELPDHSSEGFGRITWSNAMVDEKPGKVSTERGERCGKNTIAPIRRAKVIPP